jgi:hypothetical protein
MSLFRLRPSVPSRRPARRRPCFDVLEDRCVPAITSVPQTAALTEGAAGTVTAAAFTDTDNVGTNNFSSISINWGDGTAADTTTGTITQPGGAGTPFQVNGTHTYGEEGTFTVSVTFHDTLNNNNHTLGGNTANVADAPLSAGNPPSATHQEFSGVGGTNTAGGTLNALNAFKTAIGGANNGATAAPQNGGFRTITWDGVKLDGTDFGGNTTVIVPNKTVGIPINRFQNVGVIFEEVYAVSGDGFKSVNPNVNAANPPLFPAFSPNNTFAMFNENTIGLSFVLPSAPTTTPVPAATRGFGAVFLNVTEPNTSSIEYFAGDRSLGKFFVPVGTQGQPEFLGELFSSPIVTKVELTLGTDVIFNFDGTTIRPGGADNPPTSNLVDTDDFVHAEPVALTGTQPAVAAKAGVAFTGAVATFSDADPNGTASDFTATIDWGDGQRSAGTITANGQGGFNVSGTNTYASAGSFPIHVLVQDLGLTDVNLTNTATVAKTATTTALTSSVSNVFAGQSVTFTATVHASAGTQTPTGPVLFLDGGKVLGVVQLNASGQAVLTTTLTPGAHNVTAAYNGDAAFNTSTSSPVAVTINPDVTSLVNITVGKAKAKGKGRFRVHVVVQNKGSLALPAPLELVLDGLPGGVSLRGKKGVTSVFPPLGSPFADLGAAGALAPGGSLAIDLDFNAPSAKRVHFTARVLAGSSQV